MEKFTQKLIAILLCVVMIGCWLPMGAYAYEAATDSNSDGYYEIDSADKLFWFADQVNGGNTAINAILTTDITVSAGTAWTPIGCYTSASESVQFAGTFDGDGHTISGLNCADSSVGYVGLVGCLAADGAVKNVTVTGSSISGKNNVGGIVGYSYGGSVTGCSYSGTITSASGGCGGIVGYARTGTVIENCTASGTVSGGGSNTGGIAGYTGGTVRNCTNTATISSTTSGVGGIVGWVNGGSVEDCTNSGNVSSTTAASSANAGGIAGNVSGTVTGCTNTGNVTGTATIGGVAGKLASGSSVTDCANSGTVTGTLTTKGQVGGVVGYAYGLSSGSVSVSECYNTGKVSGGYQYVGGVIGQANYSEVTDCYNTGAVSGASTYVGGVIGGFTSSNNTLSDSYNYGTVTGSKSYVGGVTGSNQGTITNCFYLTDAAADAKGTVQNGTGNATQGAVTADPTGSTTGKTAAEFASGEICWLLNHSTSEGNLVWFQTIGTDYSPNFTGGTVYYLEETGTYTNTNTDSGEEQYVAQNTTTGTNYATVTEALEAASEGETVILLADCTAHTLMVTPNTILDLNGHTLTATYAVAFNTGHIIDTTSSGSLIIDSRNLILDEENSMVPVYNGTGYIFTKVGFAITQDASYEGTGIKINAMAYPVDLSVANLLKDGGADNNIKIVILLTWDTLDGVGSQEFEFTDAVVEAVYSSRNSDNWTDYSKRFTMIITGFENITNLKANVMVVSGTNVEYYSSASAVSIS